MPLHPLHTSPLGNGENERECPSPHHNYTFIARRWIGSGRSKTAFRYHVEGVGGIRGDANRMPLQPYPPVDDANEQGRVARNAMMHELTSEDDLGMEVHRGSRSQSLGSIEHWKWKQEEEASRRMNKAH